MTSPGPILPGYAELHCLSNFSFQRGASHAEELVERASALGYSALAITDECSLAGIVRAHMRAEKFGLKLLVGSEFTLTCGLKLLLLAPDRLAYGDLAELITVGRRNASKGSYRLDRDDLAAHARRLLALWLPTEATGPDEGRWLAQLFDDRAWLAVTLLHGPADDTWLAQCRWLGQQCGLPLVASGDVHMHVRSRRALQDVLTAIRLGQPVARCGLALFPNGERHLRARARLARIYPAELLAETERIAARCNFNLKEIRYEYPEELVPAGMTATEHLAALTEEGLKIRYPQGTPASVHPQIAEELAIIGRLRYEAFFLTVHDIVRFARSKDILCQGRGSAANSAVCYALGITEVRPEDSHLLFGRFISEERGEPPDIDVDFEHDRREEVIQYVFNKYGRDRAALAATVITYRTRSALRDVGRALGFAEDQLERLGGNLAWWDSPEQLAQRMIEVGLDPANRQVELLLALTRELRRFPRHLSQHVGGFVISAGPLARLVPIENAAMKDRTVIQWDKDDLEALGLLKVDVLALGMLSAIRRTLALLSAQPGRPATMQDVPRDIPEVYQMLSRGDSIGVFQVESRAQMSMLPRLKPQRFYDLVIEVAIVRPGPIQGDMVHPYLRRRNGEEPVEPMTPEVAAVLERTHGVPIFQEQVMQLAVVAAGFTQGQADDLRRSMASWRRKGTLEHYKQKLRDGLVGNGYEGAFADRILQQIAGFSEYGFPESHAASFAILVYISAWLKRFEPAAFLCGLLNALPMGFYSASQLIQDAHRHGVEVRPVDVQVSDWESTLESNAAGQSAVRLGFNRIRGLSVAAATALATARPATGYESLDDVQQRVQLDSHALNALTDAGALSRLAGHRRAAHWQVAGLVTPGDLGHTGSDMAPATLLAPSVGDDLVADYRSMGLTLAPHPLTLLRERLAAQRLLTAAEIRACPDGRIARACGIVVGRQRPGTASGVTFVTLEDETGNVNVIVWRSLADTQRRELLTSRLMAVYGVVQREGRVVHLLAKRLVNLSHLLGRLDTRSRDFH
ncbi:error-prone DNA polymerase [Chitinolyticbacter meiyuanensis]|uniref:error-prone DNA polymerase n=1 Tax=Chitinolyticbacter meiyuanensis TaxID=682798 RepID=UPI0011E5C4A0|nr:error-prone DNA polymerase [Chitinolyticbacter meiyuanensis]